MVQARYYAYASCIIALHDFIDTEAPGWSQETVKGGQERHSQCTLGNQVDTARMFSSPF